MGALVLGRFEVGLVRRANCLEAETVIQSLPESMMALLVLTRYHLHHDRGSIWKSIP